MKVYITTDLEGVAGVMLKEQIERGTKEYEEARYLQVKEINAAIEGALEAGIDEIIVMDCHSKGFNFPLEELHPEARFVMGTSRRCAPRYPFLDSSFDMTFMLGFHAMAGTQRAILEHSYSYDSVARLQVNNVEMGEIGVEALILGAQNIPVALVTGDDKACLEAGNLLGNIETAVVKYGLGRHLGMTSSPKKAREMIKRAAFNAVKRAGDFTPFFMPSPYIVETDYCSTNIADSIYTNGTDIVRAGPKKIISRVDTPQDIIYKL